MPGPYEGTYTQTGPLVNQFIITKWSENSVIISEAHRIISFDGELHGPYKEYNANGKMSKEFTYFMGAKDGAFKIYNDGVLEYSGGLCPTCLDENKFYGDIISYEKGKVVSHFNVDRNGLWYDKLNPNNPPTNPKDDYTNRFKEILPATFRTTQDGVSYMIEFDKNGTGMMMMGKYGPDNILWSVKNGDELSIYNTAFKSYLSGFKLTYSSKDSKTPVIEENSKGTIKYWYR